MADDSEQLHGFNPLGPIDSPIALVVLVVIVAVMGISSCVKSCRHQSKGPEVQQTEGAAEHEDGGVVVPAGAPLAFRS
jgi:hypothetical protein